MVRTVSTSREFVGAHGVLNFLLFTFLVAARYSQAESAAHGLQQGSVPGGTGGQLHSGALNQTPDSTDLVTAISPSSAPSIRGDKLSSVSTAGTSKHHDYKQSSESRIPNVRRQEEVLSEDCLAKRNEVLRRQSNVSPGAARAASVSTANPLAGFQRIRPRVDSTSPIPIVLNVTLANNFDGEHIPRCRQDGSYDPVQCHKIGYCWCVNKYGQAIKNSAVRAGEEPECNLNLYDGNNNQRLVVAGISAQRIKSILKPGGSNFVSSTPNGNINFEATEPSTVESSEASDVGHQQVESSAHTTSHGPVMPLVPNDCSGSRANARERAAKFVNDSIWVPECDSDDEKLYAEQQCHRMRVCWCVDQATGLPLRANEQLSSRPLTHNCTEIKRILGLSTKQESSTIGTSMSNNNSNNINKQQAQHQATFYQGSSEYCDADKRVEFVISLSNQFRQQISEYLRQNPSSIVPAELSSSNPYLISESQVARWKFSIMDRDMDGKIGDREWSKFKNNFKLVDKVAELDNPLKQQKSPYFTLTPLLIVRSQRKCWRDFLEFCGNGELVDESITISMWMGCTEVPPRSNREDRTKSPVSSSENTYALSREAAIVRSQKKNPFLGILKPD